VGFRYPCTTFILNTQSFDNEQVKNKPVNTFRVDFEGKTLRKCPNFLFIPTRIFFGGISIDPELSKRAFKITHTDAYTNLKPQERLKFIEEIERVNKFEDLPDRCKNIIISGEREIQGY